MKGYGIGWLSRWVLTTAVVSFIWSFFGPVQAQVINSWTNNGTGFWETPSNWSAGAPSSSHGANLITNANTKFVSILSVLPASTLTISNLTVSAPAGSTNFLQIRDLSEGPFRVLSNLTVNSGGWLVLGVGATQEVVGIPNFFFDLHGSFILDGLGTKNGGVLVTTNVHAYVGYVGNGQMTVSGGTWLAFDVNVGYLSGSLGTLTVDGGTHNLGALNLGSQGGTGTLWVTGGQLVTTNLGASIGSIGVGQATLSNGTWLAGGVDVSGAAGGTLTVAGGTHNLGALSVGSLGGQTGAVWVTGGQLVTTNDTSYIGQVGVGRATLSNGTWLARDVTVGFSSSGGSQGALIVAGGTNSLSAGLIVAANVTATGAVWITGGQLVVTNGASSIGASGVGQAILSNGTWLASDVFVGGGAGSQGTLTVAGGSNSLSGGLTLGTLAAATGTVSITGGQLVVTNGTTIIGYIGIGRATVSNGTWLARDLTVGTLNGSQGSLTVAGGTVTLSSSLTIGDCAPGGGTGVVTIAGGTLFVTNAAHTAFIDVRRGQLVITGGFVQTDNLVMTNDCGLIIHPQGTLIVGNLVLNPNLDADGDGMANGFEQRYGLDPLDASDASRDKDGDGQSNLAEFLAGTDPTNSASAFRIVSVARESNDVRVTWTTALGRRNYVLQTNAPPANGSFTNNFADFSPGIFVSGEAESTTNFPDVGGATNKPARYYRVRLVP